MEKIKILLFASNPEGTTPLKLDEEVRSIDAKNKSSKYGEGLELISRWAVRPDDLLQQLNRHKPAIVHFSGHGNQQGEIVLMDKDRQVKPVSAAALNNFFTTLKDNISVVVLNACYSQVQATAIAEVIDCVVGMSVDIGDEAAITFAASFYRAIGFGESVQDAFDQGKTALMLEGIPEEMTPQLLVRKGADASKLILITEVDSKQQAFHSSGSNIEVGKIEAGNIDGNFIVGNNNVIHLSPKEQAFRSLHQLPQPPADFTGRDELIAQFLADFAKGKGAAITSIAHSWTHRHGRHRQDCPGTGGGTPGQEGLPRCADLPGFERHDRTLERHGRDAPRDPLLRAGA